MDSIGLLHLCERAIEEPVMFLVETFTPYYSPYYSLMFYAIEAMPEDQIAVELGIEKGRGMFSMVYAGTNHDIYGFDSVKTEEAQKRANYAFPRVHYEVRASLPAPEFEQKIGLLHVDTEHSFAMAEAEFEAYKPYLADGAIVLFDDVHAGEDDVLNYVKSLPYPKVIDDRLHPSCGYAVVLYEQD